MRHEALPLAALLFLCAHGGAAAQTANRNEGVSFTLKPRLHMPIPHSPAASGGMGRARMSRLVPVPADDRRHAIEIIAGARKLTLRAGRAGMNESASSELDPRSRFILLMAQARLPIGDHRTIMAGFEGVKLSNRGTNVTTIAGNGRIRAYDWFLPHVRIDAAPLSNLDLTLSYRETLRGYGETGLSGPMGLRQDEFHALQRTLRPEKHSRLRLDGRWTPSPDTILTVMAYEGRLNDRLSFVHRSYLPVNGGSARLNGFGVAVLHRPSPHWRLSMRYDEARLDQTGGGTAKERRISAEAGWSSGPWSGTLRATRSSMPALLPQMAHWNRPLRIEGEMRYRLPGPGGMPASITLHLTDPDRLASTEFLRNDPAGPLHAADQARSLMLGVGLDW